MLGLSTASLLNHATRTICTHFHRCTLYTAPLAKLTVTHSVHQLYIYIGVAGLSYFGSPSGSTPPQQGLTKSSLVPPTRAPSSCQPITHLINLSLASATIPIQWKQASIRPVPKIASTKTHSDFWPLSTNSVLTRIMERTIVSDRFLYSAYHRPTNSVNRRPMCLQSNRLQPLHYSCTRSSSTQQI